MIHLGDITKISGLQLTVPVVDCIIGGSPCQDLSVAAGKRAGLEGERSGLFMEQIRIVKEMRQRDAKSGRSNIDIRPRYMVWENVPGAFSTNKGEDFRIVIEETAKVADENASIPRPEKGKWSTSGCILADGWSIAWRVFDAQFWGVPQRRRRIALVADFGGQSAPEVLFVSKSLSGDSEPGESERKGSSSDTERSSGESDCERPSISFQERGGKPVAENCDHLIFEPGSCTRVGWHIWKDGKVPSLRADPGDNHPAIVLENHPADSRVKIAEDGIVQTLNARMGTGGGNVPMVVVSLDRASYNQGKNAQFDIGISEDGVAHTCIAKGPGLVDYGVDCRNSTVNTDINGTLQAKESGGTSYNSNNVVITTRPTYIVRRLTPLECERLQGFPDGWTDIGEYTNSNGKKRNSSDASRYKALGNSIALPSWKWVLKRLCAYYERDATMASLFDGIGGFPLIWEQINGKGSCLWASEIEEFPIAVTKERIG